MRLHKIRLRIISASMNTLKHIRKNVFAVTQAEFAVVAGVTQATVSRWENGVAPSLEEMQAIRSAASARGIDWSDGLFFDVPAETAA
jgi:DNA-binding transcriptional regulator YiaG